MVLLGAKYTHMVPRHKLNDVLETEMQRVSVSTAIGVWKRFCFRFQKKKVSVVRSMETETCFLEARFLGKCISISRKKPMFQLDQGWKRKRVAFPFPREEKKQITVSLRSVCGQ